MPLWHKGLLLQYVKLFATAFEEEDGTGLYQFRLLLDVTDQSRVAAGDRVLAAVLSKLRRE